MLNINNNSVKQSDVQNTNKSIDNLTQKTNKINLSDSYSPNHHYHQANYKKPTLNSNNNNHNLYRMAYSAYPAYPMPINYPNLYSPSNFSNSNVYSRNNMSYMNTSQKRVHNLNKLWPQSLKKPAQKVNSPEIESKKLVDEEESSAKKEEPIVVPTNEEKKNLDNQANKNLIDTTKTPMCLINEMARFNKIKHEYVLLDEIGPAHKKIFYIMLKLGIDSETEESYTAQGSSIKKTQHAAAELALKQTKFNIPIKRAIKTSSNNAEPNELSSSSTTTTTTSTTEATTITTAENQTDNSSTKVDIDLTANKKIKNNSNVIPPTVRLNTLAMKLGLVANYSYNVMSYPNSINYNLDLSKKQQQQHLFDYNTYTSFMNNNNNNDKSSINHQPLYQIQRPKQFVKVKLTFADKEFNGQGVTLQIAKHDAASKALDYFSDPDKFLEAKSLSNSSQNTTVKAYRPPSFYKQQESPNNKTISNEEETESKPKSILNSEIKSEIQLVYEYGFYLKKSVDFELVQESGPSHIKKFVTKCIIGGRETTAVADKTSELLIASNDSNSFPMKTIGEGNSKKQSKKESAIKMLAILKEKFEPLILISSIKSRSIQQSKSNGTNKETETDKLLVSSSSLETTTTTTTAPTAVANKKQRKNKAKNIVKNKKTSPEYGKGSINPISRLMQIQQAKKEREPLFELLPQSAKRRQQEFVILVTVESTSAAVGTTTMLKCEGKGSTKKLAKQKAAEAMLIKLGYQSRQPSKPSLKLVSQDSSDDANHDDQDSTKASSPNDLTLIKTAQVEVIVKNEQTSSNEIKKVKFLEDPNLVLKSEDNPTAGKLKPIQQHTTSSENNNKEAKTSKKIQNNQSQANHLIKQQKIKQIQEMIANNQFKLDNNKNVAGDPNKHLDLVYKIAFELLESVEFKKKNSSDLSLREFYSETAEQLINKNKQKQKEEEILEAETNKKTEEEIMQFKILNGGLDSVNYKHILEYLAETIGFKVIYQSLLGRDSSVYSYVNLSILSATEKPLNGTGATHVESSNAAAFCALQYLSSKHTKNNTNKTKASTYLKSETKQ